MTNARVTNEISELVGWVKGGVSSNPERYWGDQQRIKLHKGTWKVGVVVDETMIIEMNVRCPSWLLRQILISVRLQYYSCL